jgi:hypothetical protein
VSLRRSGTWLVSREFARLESGLEGQACLCRGLENAWVALLVKNFFAVLPCRSSDFLRTYSYFMGASERARAHTHTHTNTYITYIILEVCIHMRPE